MNDSCDLCEVVYDEVKLFLAQQKYQNNSEKEALMKIGCHLRNLCPETHTYMYNHMKKKILDKSRQLREGNNKSSNRRKPFSRKGKSNRNEGKQNIVPVPAQGTSYRQRSKSNRNNSQGRSLNRTAGKESFAKKIQNPSSRGGSGNRDRSVSANARKFSRERVNISGRSPNVNKSGKKNQSLENTLQSLPSELKFSNEIVNKWQSGSKGKNTGQDLEWYGPNFQPRPRHVSLSNLTGARHSSKSPVSRYPEKQRQAYNGFRHSNNNNDFRSQSLDRYGRHNYSKFDNPRFNGHERNYNCQSFSKENFSNYKPRNCGSYENVSKSNSQNHFESTIRSSNSVKNVNQNYASKIVQTQDRQQNFDSLKTGRYCGSEPPSRDSSIESRASLFLPKFASRNSLHNLSDNETGQ